LLPEDDESTELIELLKSNEAEDESIVPDELVSLVDDEPMNAVSLKLLDEATIEPLDESIGSCLSDELID